MKKLMADYRNFLEEEKSQNTVLSYISDLSGYIKEENITMKKSLLKIKGDDISDYIYLLKSRGAAYATIARNIASLKSFFEYCKSIGLIKENPVRGIEVPKVQRKLPNTMTSEEVVKLLEAPDTATEKGIRDKAMLEFMYATGARVSEIIGLKTGDLSLKNEMVVLTTGKKHRFVPLGKAAIDALYKYLNDCRKKFVTGQSGDSFFLNFYGQPLSRQGFWKIVKGYIENCGIDSNVTAQTLRHSFALHLLKNGADTASVSEMLGYSDVSSTKIYLEVMNSNIKEVYKKAHPRA